MAYACCHPHTFQSSTEAAAAVLLRKSLLSIMSLEYTYTVFIYFILYFIYCKNIFKLNFIYLCFAVSVWAQFFLFLAKAQVLQKCFLTILFWMKVSNVGSE